MKTITIIFMIFLFISKLNAQTTEWSFLGSNGGWSLAHSLSGTVSDSAYTLNITGSDPYMVSATSLNINASIYKSVTFTIKNTTNDSVAGFFWATNANQNFSSSMSVASIPIVPNDTKFRTYTVDLSSDTAWTGTIYQIRLDPSQDASSGTIYLQQIQVLAEPAVQTVLSTDNGIIKIQLDLTRGGAISYLSNSDSSNNLVNIHDEGRYIQQSYYAGNPVNRLADGQNPSWSPWSWNPIQVGDSYNNRAKILAFWKHSDTLYTKCTPMLWDMNNMPAEAEMEQWSVLDSNAIKVHCKLTCHRTDNIYAENVIDNQELPATYFISTLDNLYTYMGNSPFSSAALSNPALVNLSSGFWGKYNGVNEHWMAFVNSSNWGVGVYNQDCTYFLAGISGSTGGNDTSPSTMYIAAIENAILNKNSVFNYDYDIILGTVNQIRQYVYKVGQPDTNAWDFSSGPDGWYLTNNLSGVVSDSGLTLNITGTDPYMESLSNLNIDASVYKYVNFTMENTTNDSVAGFFWTTNANQNFSSSMSVGSIPIVPNDTVLRTYTIDLSSDTAWTGTISQLRLDPVQNDTSGTIVLKNIAVSKTFAKIASGYVAKAEIPGSFSLSQNYPNPFNPTTTISYSIQKQGLVTLKVYNILGQEVATLVNKDQTAGKYAVSFDASKLASGVYIYKLTSGNNLAVKKLMLLK
ncbi:MAG: T9SS type A sorting domain-containing protein [Bacteroidia bacterium]